MLVANVAASIVCMVMASVGIITKYLITSMNKHKNYFPSILQMCQVMKD